MADLRLWNADDEQWQRVGLNFDTLAVVTIGTFNTRTGRTNLPVRNIRGQQYVRAAPIQSGFTGPVTNNDNLLRVRCALIAPSRSTGSFRLRFDPRASGQPDVVYTTVTGVRTDGFSCPSDWLPPLASAMRVPRTTRSQDQLIFETRDSTRFTNVLFTLFWDVS